MGEIGTRCLVIGGVDAIGTRCLVISGKVGQKVVWGDWYKVLGNRW